MHKTIQTNTYILTFNRLQLSSVQCWICQIFPGVPSSPSSFPFPSLPLPSPLPLSPPSPTLLLPSPLPLPPSLPSLSLLPSLPLPSPPLEVGPLFAARGCGGALKLPHRVLAEPGRQTFSGAF